MRMLLVTALALSLGACAGVLDFCPDGLSSPPAGSSIPEPHS
jgi:hypothetical protein